mmetsp:Transcript_40257/g.93629  ORF Transcript_40257/g.93629 Transcript_40257/m.93629 type:complete len:212 (+) Transcript_40257:203-838(+)
MIRQRHPAPRAMMETQPIGLITPKGLPPGKSDKWSLSLNLRNGGGSTKGSITTCIMKHMSQEPRRSTLRSQLGITCQPVLSCITLSSFSSLSMASITSTSSSRTFSNSARYSSFTCCKYMPATTMAPHCTMAASIIITLATHWYSCCLLSDTELAFSMKAAATTTGKIKRKHGAEPMSMSATRIFRMPVITAVGQSGPPTNTATLSGARPA